MKVLALPLLISGCLAAQSVTGMVTLTWAPKPPAEVWQSVRIYERSGSGPYIYTKVAEVAGDQTTVTISGVQQGPHDYVACSYNGWESNYSSPPAHVDKPIPPGNMKASGK